MHPIEEKLPHLPTKPGVYIMKGAREVVLYVGKAKNLKARVRSYVGPGSEDVPKVRFLVPKVKELDYIVTETEKEALLLENTLIKQHRPRYNVDLKDDKTYLHIVLDRDQPFPKLMPMRRPEPKPGRIVFGPYASATAVRDTLRQIQRIYPLRTCKDSELRNRKRPCLQFQMGRCMGVCVETGLEERYREMVDQAVLILQGKSEELVLRLEAEMMEASEALRFEEAAAIRDRIQSVRMSLEKQRVVGTRHVDCDVVGLYQEGNLVQMVLMQMRGGSLLNRLAFPFTDLVIPVTELLGSVLVQFYCRPDQEVPPEVLLPFAAEDQDLLEAVFKDLRGGACRIKVPVKGENRKLVNLAQLNAQALHGEHAREDRHRNAALAEVQRKLRLTSTPLCIECVDISNFQGDLAVGSCVVFQNGLPHKQGYRRYRIRVSTGVDDYGMMYEVLRRRLEKGREQADLPDLLLVDGGKGHLGVAVRVMKNLGLEHLQAAAIAKPGKQETPAGEGAGDPAGRPFDRVFVPGRSDAVNFAPHSGGLHLLQQIRDEAHRFAVTYHRTLRSKELKNSELDTIPGIGGKRKKALLSVLGSLGRIREASLEEIAKVPGMSRTAAESVWGHFHPDGADGATAAEGSPADAGQEGGAGA